MFAQTVVIFFIRQVLLIDRLNLEISTTVSKLSQLKDRTLITKPYGSSLDI